MKRCRGKERIEAVCKNVVDGIWFAVQIPPSTASFLKKKQPRVKVIGTELYTDVCAGS
jgi:hypothetical protein